MGADGGLGAGGAQAVLALFEAAGVIAMALDTDGRITYANPYLAELGGYAPDDLVGLDYFATFEPYRPPGAIHEHLGHVAANLPGPYDETVVMTRGGAERIVSWSDTLIRAEDGTIRGVVSIGQDVTDRRRAQAQLHVLAEQQAALRRVATLVAQQRPAPEIFASVARECGLLLDAQSTNLVRFEDGAARTVGAWSEPGARHVPLGTLSPLDSETAVGLVLRTGRAARVDDYTSLTGHHVEMLRRTIGIRTGAAAPVRVAGRLWGALTISGFDERIFARDAEERLAGFAELAAQAISNAEAHGELLASRARLVTAADEARRRIERDLHDGAQQRLVGLALRLRLARAATEEPVARAELDACSAELAGALDELRELAQGIHPAVLTDHGLARALESLAGRAPIPVSLDVRVHRRLPPGHEAALYFTASEGLANVAKYARASAAFIRVEAGGDAAAIEIADDGVGGADPVGGTGLRGLTDRIEALGGTLVVTSPAGAGTSLVATLPLF